MNPFTLGKYYLLYQTGCDDFKNVVFPYPSGFDGNKFIMMSNHGPVPLAKPPYGARVIWMVPKDRGFGITFAPDDKDFKGVYDPTVTDKTPKERGIWIAEASDSKYLIRNPETDHYLCAHGKRSPEADKKEGGCGDYAWMIEVGGEYPAILNLEKSTRTFETPELKDFNRPPEYTEAVYRGAAVLPHFMIGKDGDNGWKWKAENSPYYILKRWSRWKLIDWEVYNGRTGKSFGKKVHVGTTKEDAQKIDRNTTLSVSVEAGFGFKGFSTGVGMNVTNSLNVSYSSTTTRSYYEEIDEQITRPASPNGQDYAIGDWFREDLYRLYRVNGTTEVMEWGVVAPKSHVSRSYPQPKPSGREPAPTEIEGDARHADELIIS